MRKLLLWTKLLLIGALVAGCKTDGKKSGRDESDEKTSEITVVEPGESSQVFFSLDGDRFLYVASERHGHNHPQVYERKGDQDRRVTFQNGTTASPRYFGRDGWVLYASSTDELKENPPLLRGKAENSKLPAEYQQPFELYLHSPDGLEIRRLTQHEGFDGEPRMDGKDQITWTRASGNQLDVMVLPRGAKEPKRLKRGASSYVALGDQSAWLEWSQDFKTAKIKHQRGKTTREVVPEHEGAKLDLEFSPDGKWLLWSQWVDGRFEIWGQFEGCAGPLVQGRGDRRHPSVSPDLKWLTFSSWRKGRSRIARLPFPPESGPSNLKSCGSAGSS